MKKIFFILLTLLSFELTYGREIIHSFKVSHSNKNLQKIADQFEIKDRLEGFFIVYVLEEKVRKFKALAPKAILIEHDINTKISHYNFVGYSSFEEVKKRYYDLALKYPYFAKIEKYGTSQKARELFVLKDEKEPKLMITSPPHGDELITVEELLTKANLDPRLKSMIDDHEIYFIPVVNLDGFIKKSRYASGWVDPNRDSPWPDHPDRASKVTCIKHLVKFFHQHSFDGSLDIHVSK
jgi:hypothetical protein